MFIDLNACEAPAAATYDVCVVGAGAAGLSLSVELVAAGRRVMLLEAGGHDRDWRTQALYKGENIGLPYYGLHGGRCRCLGGSTTMWRGQILELDEIDFETRSWVPGSGWPFKKSELTDDYNRALELEGLSRSLDDQGVWENLRLRPYPLGEEFQVAFSRYCPEPNFARLYDSLIKAHASLTVCLHANACELLMADDGAWVAGLRWRTLTGKEGVVIANRFVLCMGGIETARFLLQPYQKGNWNRALLGRYHQDHIQCFAGALSPIKPDIKGLFGPDAVDIDGFLYRPKVKLTPSAQERFRLLHACGVAEWDDGFHRARDIRRQLSMGPLSSVPAPDLMHLLSRAPLKAWTGTRSLLDPAYRRRSSKLKLSVYCEQSPLSESRITLTGNRDALGLYRTRLDWRISQQELSTIRCYVQLARRVFSSCGYALVVPDDDLGDDEQLARKCRDTFHHMGATRMASTASDGVVDPNLRIYGTRNAYVCSSSVFPASGFSNPTHTLIALAVRLARHLVRVSSSGITD